MAAMMMNPKKKLPFDVSEPGGSPPPRKPPARALPMVDGPEEESTEQPAEESGAIPGYMGPWQRCANCAHFDGDSQCQKFNAPADMDGSCPSFEEGEGGGEEEMEGEEGQSEPVGVDE